MVRHTIAFLVVAVAALVVAGPVAGQEPAQKKAEAAASESPGKNQNQGAQQQIDFVKDVKPILESRCLRCHNQEKHEGDFQMTSKEAFFRGGLGGPPVEPGDPEASLLFELITLGPNEEGRMPPEGQPLTKEQIAVIEAWIKQGAKWPDEVELKLGPAKKKDPVDQMLSGPGLEITDDERLAIEKFQSLGALVLPIAQKTNWLRIDFSLGATHVTDNDLEPLPYVQNLVELDVAGTRITDRALEYVGQCKNLVRLHLERTQVTDEGLKHLANLPYLRYLNLYGTKITDKGLAHLKGLKNLRKLYVWQTGVTADGVKALSQALPNLEIVTGWELVAAKPQEQKEAPKEGKKPSEAKQPAKLAKEQKEQQKKSDQNKQAESKPKAKQPAAEQKGAPKKPATQDKQKQAKPEQAKTEQKKQEKKPAEKKPQDAKGADGKEKKKDKAA